MEQKENNLTTNVNVNHITLHIHQYLKEVCKVLDDI